jgi:hypothetical protein
VTILIKLYKRCLRTLVASEGFNPMRTKCRAQKSKIGSRQQQQRRKMGSCVCVLLSLLCSDAITSELVAATLFSFLIKMKHCVCLPPTQQLDAPNSDLMVATVFHCGQIRRLSILEFLNKIIQKLDVYFKASYKNGISDGKINHILIKFKIMDIFSGH